MKGRIVFIYARPCAGKTTVGKALQNTLPSAVMLDGDEVRRGMNSDLGFDEVSRSENIRRVCEAAKLLSDQAFDVIMTFVAPTESARSGILQVLEGYPVTTVCLDTPAAVCEDRDVKGMYARARKGEIKNFTGVDAPFEAGSPDIHIGQDGSIVPVDKCVNIIKDAIYRYQAEYVI